VFADLQVFSLVMSTTVFADDAAGIPRASRAATQLESVAKAKLLTISIMA
jgi:hypothetical protein